MFPWNMVSVNFVGKDIMNKNILRIMRENALLGNLKVVSEGEASKKVIDAIVRSPPWLM